MLMLGIFWNGNIDGGIGCVYYSGKLRALASKIAVSSRLMWNEIQKTTDLDKQNSIENYQRQLQGYKQDFTTQYNSMLYGPDKRNANSINHFLAHRAVQQMEAALVLNFWSFLGIAMAAVQDIISRPLTTVQLPWVANNFSAPSG